eukprot:scaffold835_cov199-Isochrysis_galbana.AAC.1
MVCLGFYPEKRVELRLATAGWKWWWVRGVVPRGSSEDSFYPKKGGVESKTAGCNGGRCLPGVAW